MLRSLTVVACTLLLASCALLENQYGREPYQAPQGGEPNQEREGPATSTAELARQQEQQRERPEPVIFPGSDRQWETPEPVEPVRLVGEAVSLNFENAPLEEVVHAVLGDILELDYIVDHPVQGKITLRSRSPIPRDQLLQVLESLLEANNVVMTRDGSGRFLVTGSGQASRLSPRLGSARSPGAGHSTVVVPLQYISAGAMADILRPMADEEAFVRVDNRRNLLILAGTQAQLGGWLDMVSTFDVDMLAGMSVGLFPLENSRVEETAQVLNSMLGANAEGSELAGLVNIIPVQRLNSLLVVTPRAHYLDTVGTWVERLDVRPDSSFEKRLFVYPVQNTSASRLAELINGIYSGGSGGARGVGTGTGNAGTGGVAPGMSMESISSSSSGSVSGGSSGTRSSGGGSSDLDSNSGSGSGFASSGRSSASTGSGNRSSGGSGGSLFGGSAGGSGNLASQVGSLGAGGENSELADVRVVADEVNNALMIYATGKQYRLIEDALTQLDVVATQVIIEASILEVTLTEELSYGLEWTFKNGLGSNYDGSGSFPGSGPSSNSAGFSYTVTNGAGNISAVLNALSGDSLINVISSPSVMVLDNHPAYIHVGDQVPVRQGRTVSESGGFATENIVYRDTGVKLMVQPSVNAGGLVTMDVEQSVTDVGTSPNNSTDQPTFLERSVVSRVAVRSDESVVLGGLIRENASATDRGVPFLHRMPVLGALFGSTGRDNRRTELLVILTPRVINDEQKLRDIGRELRSRVRSMELIQYPAPTHPSLD
ncbi:MAG: type II secretion system protein GspD [Haliea sp.]|nr:type II secretion system protein GspD [Haliea sp.]|tara:strand:+ start:67452 stop:69767 length:2316 start_codon:yes stop_codon:yes gene_type:complete